MQASRDAAAHAAKRKVNTSEPSALVSLRGSQAQMERAAQIKAERLSKQQLSADAPPDDEFARRRAMLTGARPSGPDYAPRTQMCGEMGAPRASISRGSRSTRVDDRCVTRCGGLLVIAALLGTSGSPHQHLSLALSPLRFQNSISTTRSAPPSAWCSQLPELREQEPPSPLPPTSRRWPPCVRCAAGQPRSIGPADRPRAVRGPARLSAARSHELNDAYMEEWDRGYAAVTVHRGPWRAECCHRELR